MTLVYLVGASVLAAILSFLLTPLVRRFAIRVGAVDAPGPRKVHTAAIPRLGGLAVVASCAIVTALLLNLDLPRVDRIAGDLALGLSIGLSMVLLVGVWDDIRPLRAAPKFAGQIAAASAAIACGIHLGPEVHLFDQSFTLGWLAMPISLLWIVGVTNAFNIVDGLDGLSAGLALLSALSLAGGALMLQQYGMVLLALVLAGALIGFLPYNMYPAKIFLGDSGATAIGFLLACLALRGGSSLSSGLAIITPILVLGVPITETLVSMLRRVVRGLRGDGAMGVFKGDAGHFHHRLLALGFTHRHAVMILYGVGLALALAGFASLFLSSQKAAVLLLTMLAGAFVALSGLGYKEFAVLSRGDLLRLYDLPLLQRNLFIVLMDLAIVMCSIYGASVLKYDDWALASNRPGARWLLAALPALSLASFHTFGLYRRLWRFASMTDIGRSSIAVTVAVAATAVLSMLINAATPPASWFVICYILCLFGINGSRASYRFLRDFAEQSQARGEAVLIFGAGRRGRLVRREMRSSGVGRFRVVGFLDDDPALFGTVLDGCPVLGPLSALGERVSGLQVRGVIVAIRHLSPDDLQAIARACEENGIWAKQLRIGYDSLDPIAVLRSAPAPRTPAGSEAPPPPPPPPAPPAHRRRPEPVGLQSRS